MTTLLILYLLGTRQQPAKEYNKIEDTAHLYGMILRGVILLGVGLVLGIHKIVT